MALGIAQRGGTVYLLCRSPERAEEARKEIIEKTQNQKVFVRIVDLADLRGISLFARQFVDEVQRLDVLVRRTFFLFLFFGSCTCTCTCSSYSSSFFVDFEVLLFFLLSSSLFSIG